MSRKFNIALAAAAALVFALFIFVLLRLPGDHSLADPSSATGLTVGQRAPEFSGATLEGLSVRLSEFRGQPVLINIFASWCGPCQIEAPHLVAIHQEYDGQVQVIGINLQETPAAVASFQQTYAIDFPLVLDPGGELTEIYRPVGLPTTWFIDPQGVIRYVHAGPLTLELLQQAIQAAQAGKNFNPFGS